MDSVSPIFKGVEILPDGSVVRAGTNYSGKFQEAHDASKASIQSRISNLESGGVKGTGETPKITEIKEKDLGKHIIKGKMEEKNWHQTCVILPRMVINIQQMSLVE